MYHRLYARSRGSASMDVVAVCNCLITEDSCRPALAIHGRKHYSHIFCYTFVANFSTKHADIQSIFTSTSSKNKMQFAVIQVKQDKKFPA